LAAVTTRPAIVPYIREQLAGLEMIDDDDYGGTFRAPVTINGSSVCKTTPLLYDFNYDSRRYEIWSPPPPPVPFISETFGYGPPPEDDNYPDEFPSDVVQSCHEAPMDISTEVHSFGGTASSLSNQTFRAPSVENSHHSASNSSHRTYSDSDERDGSKDRMHHLEISPLPLTGKDLKAWNDNLTWILSGHHWCHQDVHACDILETTDDNKVLSYDFLVALKRAATNHTSTSEQRAAMSLLQDELLGVNVNELIKNGKGFELYQSRVKTGFSQGLGTETILNLRTFIQASQNNHETVGAFFKRLQQLYKQVQTTKGCEIGDITRKAFALEGLANGAYHKILAPFVSTVQLGNGKLKLHIATLGELQSVATDRLVSRKYYKEHAIQPGLYPNKARAATDTPAPAPHKPAAKDEPCTDPMIENIVSRIRHGQYLNGDMTSWMMGKFRCVICWGQGHDTVECSRLKTRYNVTAKLPSSGKPPAPPSGSGGYKGRMAQEEPKDETAAKAQTIPKKDTAAPTAGTDPGERASYGSTEVETIDEESETDESDDAFSMFDTLTHDDDNLLAAVTKIAARKADDVTREQLLRSSNLEPISLQDKVQPPKPIPLKDKGKAYARMAKNDLKWLKDKVPMCEDWEQWHEQQLDPNDELANVLSPYRRNRILCPDSGATSVMCPYSDMFRDYEDVRHERRYV
jgi:hypothetical protein